MKRVAAHLIRGRPGSCVRAAVRSTRAHVACDGGRATVREQVRVETAMTIDAVRAGLRVVEIPIDGLEHRDVPDPAGFLHRGCQGWDIAKAVLPRMLR